ncbi:MAG: hypothetical protein MK089_07595 [Phycisphaerales bacterium]|nr:hypothetical protein [Phycisphaerales bacterium]
MAQDVHRMIVDEMEFGKVFRFGRVLKAVGSSLQPGRLAIGVLVMALLGLGGQVSDWLAPGAVPAQGLAAEPWDGNFSVSQKRTIRMAANKWTDLELDLNSVVDPSVVLAAMRERHAASDGIEAASMDDFLEDFEEVNGTRGLGPFESTVSWVGSQLNVIVNGTASLSPTMVAEGACNIMWGTPVQLMKHGQWRFLLFMGLWFLFLLAAFGGGLCRMEAVAAAGGERMSSRDALDFAWSRLTSMFGSLLVPLALAAFLAIVLLLVGLLMNVPVLNVVVAVFYVFSLITGLGVTLLVIGYAICGGMLVPSVAVENCDGGDAMQRAYGYMVARPLHLILYLGMLFIGLALGFLLVFTVVNATMAVTAGLQGEWSWNNTFVNAGGTDEIFAATQRPAPAYDSWWTGLAGGLIGFWESVMIMIVLGWIFSYLCASWTRVYLLMRRAVDGLEEDCIWFPGLMPGTLAPEHRESSSNTDD